VKRAPLIRVLASAALALLLPFLVGALAAYYYFLRLPGWSVDGTSIEISASAIGLCVAVSALPVLIGIVRELAPAHRHYGRKALSVAVIDDAALWLGLALLQLVAVGHGGLSGWGWGGVGAIVALLALIVTSAIVNQRVTPPLWVIWVSAVAYLAIGSWATSQLGLHALIGAYFAGTAMPVSWLRRLPIERLGIIALSLFAPLFFGHSGLKIESEALNGTSAMAAIGLLVLSVLSKLGAIVIYPPAVGLSRREAFAIGTLLQCKGLMEIVAATILRDQGMISANAYAALVMLAVISTTLTAPLFRYCLRDRQARSSGSDTLPRPL
jgi:Kef-type K+ transport system membrane component KefB